LTGGAGRREELGGGRSWEEGGAGRREELGGGRRSSGSGGMIQHHEKSVLAAVTCSREPVALWEELNNTRSQELRVNIEILD